MINWPKRYDLSYGLFFLLLIFCNRPTTIARAETKASFYLRANDRVVFYGDSITEQGYYTLPIEVYLATRHPELNISFINSGWSGDRSWGGEGGMLAERLKRDVLAYKPTVVTVMLGMNDGYYTNFDQSALDAFKKSIIGLVTTLKSEAPRVRITLIGTSPYDNVTPGEQPEWEAKIEGGYDSIVARYSEAMSEVAKEHGLLFVDMHEPLVKLIKEVQRERPDLARELIPDRIHPSKTAGLVMAAELLAAWNAPATNEVIIDGSELDGDGLTLQQRLPARISVADNAPLASYLLKHIKELQSFATPSLRVANLPVAKVSLRIDGQGLGTFSAEQLKSGIELNERSLPENSTDHLAELIQSRHRLNFVRRRHLGFHAKGKRGPVKQAIAELNEIEQNLLSLQNDLVNANSHVIELMSAD